MCGRFTQIYTWAEVHAFLSVFGTPQNLRPRYNIAPTTMIDVVRLVDGQRELIKMRWGLVPFFWKKGLKEVPATFNARAETVHEKPMFRDAFKRGRRCIIPASGFYEWTGPKTERQPHLFTAADGAPILGLAGLWDRWKDPATGDEVLSCTMIVSGASEWMEAYHDRMPVILKPDQFDRWLSGEMTHNELEPAAEELLRERMVSRRVNKAGEGDDDPAVLRDAN